MMKTFLRFFALIQALMATLFVVAALALILISARVGWVAFAMPPEEGAQAIIEAIGFLAAAVVALQIAQTLVEEEVIREAHVSGPTRVRRFLSRFLVVIVVATAIEGLVATFRAVHVDPTQLPRAASILVAAGVLLACWGIFVRLNGFAEKLEPEAMEQATREDRKLERVEGKPG